MPRVSSRRTFALLLVAAGALAASAPAAQAAPPNVLVIITDDQRDQGTMAAMPRTSSWFGGGGTNYENAYVTTPLCCPSRASIFSGKYVHNHGVTTDNGSLFDASQSWQRYLHDSGYRTGIIGKYLNGVNANKAPYFDYRDPNNPTDSPEETRTAAVSADDFLQSTEANDSQPWALVMATYSPHTPYSVEPADPFPYPDFQPSGSFNERDLSDKNPAVSKSARQMDLKPNQYQAIYNGQMTELEAVDELVGHVHGELNHLGETSNTLAIYISDNGYLEKDHRIYHKNWPYLQAVQVPMYMTWPGHVAAGTTSDAMVANIDIAPTIFQASGVQAGYPVDGRSLFTGTGHDWLLLEFPTPTDDVPSWFGYLQQDTREYIEWDGSSTLGGGLGGGLASRNAPTLRAPGSGLGGGLVGNNKPPFVEDYDLTSDPDQLNASNVADPSVSAEIAAAKRCVGSACP